MSARLLLTLPTTSSPQSPPPHRISIPPSLLSLSFLFLQQLHPFYFLVIGKSLHLTYLLDSCISSSLPSFLSCAGQQTTQSLLPLYTLAHRLPQSKVCCLCLDLCFSSICVLLVFLLSIQLSIITRTATKKFPLLIQAHPRYTQRTVEVLQKPLTFLCLHTEPRLFTFSRSSLSSSSSRSSRPSRPESLLPLP